MRVLDSALQWQPTLPVKASMHEFNVLGCHVAYVINAAHRGDYSWHEYCVRFWLILNYKNEMDEQVDCAHCNIRV